ncbi:hypothetical protein GJV06_19220 [Enterobacteriaceae bacterium RIT691]|nr:hypothetical protein [Enterobacteriaceae bacterium RIT691]
MVHASGQESIDIVIIDDDALSRGKAPYHWLNSFEGLKQAGIIILSGSYSLAEVTEKLRKGAKACVGKHMPLELLHEAITSVLNGECWVEEDLRHHYSLPDKRRYGGVMIPEIVQFNILTAAEKTVIRKLLQGMTVTDIANKTCRSVKTISSQKQSAMRKLQVNSIVELYRTFSKVAAN